MEEQVLFFTSQSQSLHLLQQMARTSARHLILVLPENLGRLAVNLFLRLVRKQIAGQPLALTVVSGNRQARLLAEQIGFASAATLDEARGLKPAATSIAHRRSRQMPAPADFPVFKPLGTSRPVSAISQPTQPPEAASAASPLLTSDDPHAHLEHLLREGYLANPSSIPSLEEEAQHAAREEEARQSRLNYEIADERTPLLAQEEAEEHEAQIISIILKTSRPLPPAEMLETQHPTSPLHPTDFTQPPASSEQGQGSGTLRAEHNHDEQAPGANTPKPQ